MRLPAFTSALLASAAALAGGAISQQPRPEARFQHGAVMSWNGLDRSLATENLILLWSFNGSTVTLFHDRRRSDLFPVKLEVVGFAAHDPRPCAQGTRVWLSSMAYSDDVRWTTQELPCGPVMGAMVGADGFAWHWPERGTEPLLEPCHESPGDFPIVTFGAHYCDWTIDKTTHPVMTSECFTLCGRDPSADRWPAISFLLVRPIL